MASDDELSEFMKDPLERANAESVDDPVETETKKKTRKLPDLWTRVISMDSDDLVNMKMHPLATDLLLRAGFQKIRKKKGDPEWECFFSPKIYIEMHPNPDLDRMRLSEDRFKRYGEQVTRIRTWITERASEVDTGEKMDVGKLLQEVSHVEKRKWQRERKRHDEANPISPKDLIVSPSQMLRRRGSRRGQLTPADRISIAYLAMVKNEKQEDIAKAFRTT